MIETRDISAPADVYVTDRAYRSPYHRYTIVVGADTSSLTGYKFKLRSDQVIIADELTYFTSERDDAVPIPILYGAYFYEYVKGSIDDAEHRSRKNLATYCERVIRQMNEDKVKKAYMFIDLGFSPDLSMQEEINEILRLTDDRVMLVSMVDRPEQIVDGVHGHYFRSRDVRSFNLPTGLIFVDYEFRQEWMEPIPDSIIINCMIYSKDDVMKHNLTCTLSPVDYFRTGKRFMPLQSFLKDIPTYISLGKVSSNYNQSIQECLNLYYPHLLKWQI